MDRNSKLIILLLFLALILLLYLLMSTKQVTIRQAANDSSLPEAGMDDAVDPLQLENRYKAEYSALYRQLEDSLLAIQNLSAAPATTSVATGTPGRQAPDRGELADDLSRIRVELMKLTVPEQYRDTHVRTVLLAADLRSAAVEADSGKISEAGDELQGLRSKQPWLGDNSQ